MVKDTQTVIQYGSLPPLSIYEVPNADKRYREFNELVNMNADELTEWLGSDESAGAGWSKDDGSGETIGHER